MSMDWDQASPSWSAQGRDWSRGHQGGRALRRNWWKAVGQGRIRTGGGFKRPETLAGCPHVLPWIVRFWIGCVGKSRRVEDQKGKMRHAPRACGNDVGPLLLLNCVLRSSAHSLPDMISRQPIVLMNAHQRSRVLSGHEYRRHKG